MDDGTEAIPFGPDRFRLDGRVAMVTGAGGMFGRAIAIGLARAGAALFITDIDAATLATTAELVAGEGGRCAATAADGKDPTAIEAAFATLDATYGRRLDVLVNNAGINPRQGRPEDIPLATWDHVLATNLSSYFLHAQAAARRMIAGGRGGAIVNISSIAGANALGRGNLAFGVSKAGVDQMTRELATEWAHRGIRVNSILPCQFLNDGLRAYITDPANATIATRMLDGIPMGRMGRADEIVGPVLFLASPAASMVTGVNLAVDGGNLALNAGGTLPRPD